MYTYMCKYNLYVLVYTRINHRQQIDVETYNVYFSEAQYSVDIKIKLKKIFGTLCAQLFKRRLSRIIFLQKIQLCQNEYQYRMIFFLHALGIGI